MRSSASQLKVIQPVFDNDPAFVEGLLVYTNDNSGIGVVVIVDIDGMFLETNII